MHNVFVNQAGNGVDGQSLTPVTEQQRFVTKTLLSLVAGDRFTAVVRDMQPGRVSLQFADDSRLDARTVVMPDVRIGDMAAFLVKENAKGQLLLELVKPSASEAEYGVGAGVLRDALAAADLPVTEDTLRLVGGLVRYNAPIHGDALRNASYFAFIAPELSDKQLAFLVREELPPTKKTVELFRGFDAGTQRLAAYITDIAKLACLEKGEIREKVMDIISRNGIRVEEAELEKGINLLFRMDMESEESQTQPAMVKHFQKANEAAAEMLKILPQDSQLAARLDGFAESLRFMGEIHASKQFIQVPYTFKGRDGQGDLHVLARRGRKRTSSCSALLALELANLGQVEAFVQKTDAQVTLQFRTADNKVLKALAVHMPELVNVLSASGYHLSSVAYKISDEKLGFTDVPVEENEQPEVNRYSFDVRV